MNNTPKKSNTKKRVTKVSSLTQFVEWVNNIGGQNMLFRGLANRKWGGESSLYRELKNDGFENINDIFLAQTEELIEFARNNEYDMKESRECKLKDLELLADLQHNKDIKGIDTCLIDFTTLSFVALYFACGSLDNKFGRVIAFSKDNTDFNEIANEDIKKEIRCWLKKDKSTWIFSPPQELNNRIISQQSVFVFGNPILCIKNFYICEITDKTTILEELKKNGINKTSVGMSTVSDTSPMQSSRDEKYANGNIEYYDKAIKDNHQNSIAYNNRGVAKNDLYKFEDAIRDFNKAIKLNLKYSEAYNNRGIAKFELKANQDAIRDFNKAIKLNPENYRAYYNRGIAKYRLGGFQDAINNFNKAIRLNPKYYEAYNNRGIAKNKLEKFQNAIRDYNKAIESNPKYWNAYYNRGIAKNKLNNFQDAVSDFSKVIDSNPKHWDAYIGRGNAKSQLEGYQDAINDYDKAIELNPKNPLAYYNRRHAKIKLGDKKGAVVDFAKAKEFGLEF